MIWTAPLNLEDQCFNGIFESDDCWDFSGVSLMEIRLKNVFPQFSAGAQNFFLTKGFCDAQGNFALSRRYIANISGVKNNGNYQGNFWLLAGQYGMIPRSVLDFTPTSTNDPNYAAFVADFFNPDAVTPDMITLGKEFLNYISVSSNDIQMSSLDMYLETTPVQVGIPIPKIVSNWNQADVTWDGSTTTQHSVVLLGINPDGTRVILDSYLQWIKTLSANYPLNIITVPDITIKEDMLSPELSTFTWQKFVAILRKIGIISQ